MHRSANKCRCLLFLPTILLSVISFAFPATDVYRSAGFGNTGDLNVDSRTVGISADTATFSGAMRDSVGVGDVLQYTPQQRILEPKTSKPKLLPIPLTLLQPARVGN